MAKHPHKAGVYIIELIAAERFYIGSSMNIPDRWYGHRQSLIKGTHTNTKLQTAWSTYGPTAFVWRIVEELPHGCTKIELLAREQHYIDSLRPWFNIMPTAGSRLGSKTLGAGLEHVRAAANARSARTTHCPKGHEYTPENTYLTKRNQRVCLRCAADKQLAKHVHTSQFRIGGPVCRKGHEWTPQNTITLATGTRQCRACKDERQRTKNERTRERYNAGPELRERRRADHERHRDDRLAQMREYGRDYRARLKLVPV